MNELQVRLELQGSIQQYIENFLNQGIPATMMEDALNKVLLFVKDKAVTEFLISAQTQQEERTPQEVE